MNPSANSGFDLFDDPEVSQSNGYVDASDFIVDIREYDVPYHVRVAIDKGGLLLSPFLQFAKKSRYPSGKVVLGRGKTRYGFGIVH